MANENEQQPTRPQQKRGLGRGLSALIPSAATGQTAAQPAAATTIKRIHNPDSEQQHPHEEPKERLLQVELRAIALNPQQPRKTFGKDELEDLTASIREHGVLQPIVVRELARGSYELIAGERRFRAASAAGLTHVPAVVRQNVSDSDSLALALIENVQREDLNPVETAEAYAELLHTFNMTQAALAQAVGKRQPQIANSLRLLNLPADVRESVRNAEISEGHAKVILSCGDEDLMRALWLRIKADDLTVRQTESTAASMRQTAAKVTTAAPLRTQVTPDPHLAQISEKISLNMGTRVRLVPGRGQRGTIEISYYDHDQLEGLLDKLSR